MPYLIIGFLIESILLLLIFSCNRNPTLLVYKILQLDFESQTRKKIDWIRMKYSSPGGFNEMLTKYLGMRQVLGVLDSSSFIPDWLPLPFVINLPKCIEWSTVTICVLLNFNGRWKHACFATESEQIKKYVFVRLGSILSSFFCCYGAVVFPHLWKPTSCPSCLFILSI